MRKYTLLFSIAAHAALAAALVVPIFATTELPDLPRITEFVLVTPTPPPPAPEVRIRRVEQTVSLDTAPIVEPDSITPEPPPVDPGIGASDTVPGFVTGTGTEGLGLVDAPPPASRPPISTPPEVPRRVGGVIQPPRRIHEVAPVYPPIARSAGIKGIVILEAVIDREGRVTDARVLRSVSLLDDAALAAVKQWRFTPTLLNGEPIPIVMTVTVTFTLN